MTIGQEIKLRREQLGMSQTALAKKVGTNQQTIGKIEQDIIKHSRFFPGIAQVLEIPINNSHPAVMEPQQRVSPGVIPGNLLTGTRDLPVHAAAEGGRGQLIVSTDPVDWELRPSHLANVKDAYGLIIIGESMSPEFEPGDIALINPHLPPIRGKTYVFYTEPEHGETKATIKRLVKYTDDQWHVRQWNPPSGDKSDFTLPRRIWTRCHCIVGRHNAR